MCSYFEQHIRKHGLNPFGTRLPSRDLRQTLRPTQQACTVDAEGEQTRYWSLIPPWAKTRKQKYSSFNARAETVSEKPVFRHAWHTSQRCLIPASAYFEWPAINGAKTLHRIQREDTGVLWLAGLWERWDGEEPPLSSCTMITIAANADMAWVHPRMPRILETDELDAWLHGSPEEAASMLKAPVKTRLEARPADENPARSGVGTQADLFAQED